MNLKKRILILDPGVTTGFAEFGANHLNRVGVMNYSIVPDYIWHNDFEAVVVEDYITGSRIVSQSQRATLKLLGAIEYVCKLKNIGVILLQPAFRKFYNKEKVIERLGEVVYEKMFKGRSEHEKDAVKHGLYYFEFVKRS